MLVRPLTRAWRTRRPRERPPLLIVHGNGVLASLTTALSTHTRVYSLAPDALRGKRRPPAPRDVVAVILSIDGMDSQNALDLIARAARWFPRAAITLYADAADATAQIVREASYRHPLGVIRAGLDDSPERAWAAVLDSIAVSVAQWLHAALVLDVPHWFRDACALAVRHALTKNFTVSALARMVGMTYGDFYKASVLHKLPLPLAILDWGRIFVTSWLYTSGFDLVKGVQEWLPSHSARAFREMFTKRCGFVPSEVAQWRHGFTILVIAFNRCVSCVPRRLPEFPVTPHLRSLRRSLSRMHDFPQFYLEEVPPLPPPHAPFAPRPR